MKTNRATMADVAERAGVSRQLVGLVFQGKYGFSVETEAKVRKAATELGYRPNLAAQALRRDTTRLIGVLFDPRESSPLEIIQTLYKVAAVKGYELVLSAISEDRDEDEAIHELIGFRCEGLILIASRLNEKKLSDLANEISFVSIGRELQIQNCDSVRSDGQFGLSSVVSELVGKGHSRIAYLNAQDMLDGGSRLSGYLTAMEKYSLTPQVVDISGDYTEESGAIAARRLLKHGLLPTAIACSNDQQALGLISEFRASSINVPRDVSVTGYDDSRVARFSFLNLTTVHQDPNELAERALELLLGRIVNPNLPGRSALTSATLISRQSVVAKSL